MMIYPSTTYYHLPLEFGLLDLLALLWYFHVTRVSLAPNNFHVTHNPPPPWPSPRPSEPRIQRNIEQLGLKVQPLHIFQVISSHLISEKRSSSSLRPRSVFSSPTRCLSLPLFLSLSLLYPPPVAQPVSTTHPSFQT